VKRTFSQTVFSLFWRTKLPPDISYTLYREKTDPGVLFYGVPELLPVTQCYMSRCE